MIPTPYGGKVSFRRSRRLFLKNNIQVRIFWHSKREVFVMRWRIGYRDTAPYYQYRQYIEGRNRREMIKRLRLGILESLNPDLKRVRERLTK